MNKGHLKGFSLPNVHYAEYDIKKVLDRPFSKLKRDLLIAISELNPNIAILEYLNKEK